MSEMIGNGTNTFVEKLLKTQNNMNKIFSKLIGIFLLSINVACNAQNNQINETQIADINNLVEDLANKDAFSGTVLIAKGDKILYQKAVGLANKGQNFKNNIDTKFNVGSMNKMFTAVAIAQLVEKSKLNYTDKLTKHLPNLPAKTFGDITIEQLLTHSAGTGDFFQFSKFESVADTAKTIDTYVNIGLNEPLAFKPGAKVQYSNYGFVLLGAVIEKVSKMSYFDYVKQNIFIPISMTNTDFSERDKTHENLAIGYMGPPFMPGQSPQPMVGKIKREDNTRELEVKGNSAGGGYSTVIDFHKFSMGLLSGKLLSANSLAAITTGKVTLLPAIKERNLPEVKYGYGFGEIYRNDNRMFGHTGGAPGVDGQLEIYPDLGYTVVILSNYDRATMPIMRMIQEMIVQKK
jgi:CubicO group peptidase (beta-lactamase class C family)